MVMASPTYVLPFGGISDSASPSSIHSGPHRNGGSGLRAIGPIAERGDPKPAVVIFRTNGLQSCKRWLFSCWAQNPILSIQCTFRPVVCMRPHSAWLWCHLSTCSYTFSPCDCVNGTSCTYLWIRNENVRSPNNPNCHFECGRPSDEPEDEIQNL